MYTEPTKKTDTRSAMISAAIELFKQQSYDEVSVKDICDAAGVTRNSFYYYFNSKELLFDAIGDWVSGTSKDRIVTLLAGNSYYQQFWEFYHAYLITELELGPEIMNHVCISRTAKGRPDYFSYIDAPLSDSMIKLLTLAQKEGQIFNPAPPEDLLWTSYSLIRGVNIKWCFQWGACDLISESRKSMDVLCLPGEGFGLR